MNRGGGKSSRSSKRLVFVAVGHNGERGTLLLVKHRSITSPPRTKLGNPFPSPPCRPAHLPLVPYRPLHRTASEPYILLHFSQNVCKKLPKAVKKPSKNSSSSPIRTESESISVRTHSTFCSVDLPNNTTYERHSELRHSIHTHYTTQHNTILLFYLYPLSHLHRLSALIAIRHHTKTLI